jgi:hypothetical protein
MDGLDGDFGLTLRSGPMDVPTSGVWADLARVARWDDESVADPGALAASINTSPHALRMGHRIYAVIKQTVDEARSNPSTAANGYDRISRLIAGLQSDWLEGALFSQTDLADRTKTLKDAVANVTSPAVRALAVAAAASYEQPASKVLKSLLQKLEQEISDLAGDARAQADQALRSLVHQLIDTWAATRIDVNASGFDHLFTEATPTQIDPEITPEAERIIHVAIESGSVGGVLWNAIAEFTAQDKVAELLNKLKDAPPASRAADVIGQQFANAQQLAILLREQTVDFDAVDAVLRHMQLAAAETLLNELIRSNHRVTRRGILERLARMGPGIEPMLLTRFKDERWFVLRNMLHLLNESGSPTTRIAVAEFQTHTDARVRREAMLLLFKDPIARDRALANAFKESDSAMLRVALREARNGLPDAGVPTLAKRIVEPDFPPEFRIPAIQLLGRSKSLLALEALLKYVSGGTTLLGKPKLAPKSSEMVAALKALSRGWSQERRAKALLDLAAASSDPNIAAAANAKSTPTTDTDDDGLE